MVDSQQTRRIFIGLSVSDEVGSRIAEVSRKLKKGADKSEIDVMWSPKTNWHVTLAFMGDISLEKLAELEKCLKDFFAGENPLSISVRKLGAFPEIRAARTLWAGVTKSDNLVMLRNRLGELLKKRGLADLEQDFTPHITLGRLRNHKNITDLLSPFIRSDFGKINVEEAILYESQQLGSVKTYLPLVRYSLISR